MCAVSVISTMKVDWPRARLSLAPTRVKTRSHSPISAARAGTKQPAWAITTVSATCRITVLLPAMFGPVITRICADSRSRRTSLGTNSSPAGSDFSTTGCRPPSIDSTWLSSSFGRT